MQPFMTQKIEPKLIDVQQNDISAVAWCPVKDLLASANWGGECKIWEVKGPPLQFNVAPYPKVLKSQSPILSLCWGTDRVFIGNVDGTIQMHTLGTPTDFENLGETTGCVKCLKYFNQRQCLISAGYDKKLKIWDYKSKSKVLEIDLPERVYAMDLCTPNEVYLVLGMAGKQIRIYDMRNLSPTAQPIQQHESPLSHQIRCISCFSDSNGGWATGTIEGRMRINYFEEYIGPQPQNVAAKDKKSFSFKCHRENTKKDDPNTKIYTINDTAFHPTSPCFASCGSDGGVIFWDKNGKQKLKNLPTHPMPVVSGSFSKVDGNYFAYATGYDWSKGAAGRPPMQTNSELRIVPSDIMKEKDK